MPGVETALANKEPSAFGSVLLEVFRRHAERARAADVLAKSAERLFRASAAHLGTPGRRYAYQVPLRPGVIETVVVRGSALLRP